MLSLHIRLLFIVLSFFLSFSVYSQRDKLPAKDGRTLGGRQLNDTLANGKFAEEAIIELSSKTHYTDYRIISYAKDTTVIDTTLSLKKERLFNHLRKNLFEKQAFHNLGSPFNYLGFDFSETNLLPKTGVRAKHQGFLEIEDVQYFRVPTPTTELFFRTGIQQGQVLNSVFTTNITPDLNFSIAYKGLRSLGDFQSALASHQNVRITTSFQTKNKRYRARAHFVTHNLMNQENGGLTENSVDLFLTNDANFRDRERLVVNFINAESRLKTKRYYLEHTYDLWTHKDTTKRKHAALQLGQVFSLSKKHYNFEQDKFSSFIGEAFQNNIADSTYHNTMHTTAFIRLQSPYILGSIGFKTKLAHYKYGYNSLLLLENQTIPNRLKGNTLSAEAHWDASFKTFSLKSKIGTIVKGNLKGNYLSGTATYKQDSLFTAKATLTVNSRAPNFNFQLFQSDYIAYNWHNSLQNEHTQFLGFSLESEKLVHFNASVARKENYTYFDVNSTPQQYNGVLSYVKAKVQKTFTYKKFTLDNTLLYQKVLSGNEVFKVPELLTENSLFFTDYVFKGDPLFLQTGFTFKYFTQYKADEFNPLLNEFRLQNEVYIGNYPMLDFFVNGQIRRTRLFFKLENISSLFLGHNYFATPTQPYRDFKVRFGVVWNFFI